MVNVDVDEIYEIGEMINEDRFSKINGFLIKRIYEVLKIEEYFVDVQCTDGTIYKVQFEDNWIFKGSALIIARDDEGEYPFSILSVTGGSETTKNFYEGIVC